ncbi:MAG: acyl-CoA dehydrogenase [Fimbriimonadaceae bacterium]|jgi:acyl-CoA dehydrogenase|nr:acyl-CoA dehydrogenase [Fimbriimonadaceae bacterium]
MPDRTFLEWPFFEDRHRELAEAIEAWCGKKLRPHRSTDIDSECCTLVRELASAGILRYAAPEAEKLDVRSLCIIRETLARYSGLADFSFAMQGLGSGPISLFGSDELKREFLPAVRAGKMIAAFALSEPEAGSDVAALAMTAELDGDEYVLNGRKTWVSNGGIADFYVVFARTGEGEGAKGLSAFVVDAATEGLRVAERIQVMAPHPLAKLAFKDCRVPASRMLGEPGQGFKVAMSTLDVFRPTVGAAALGFGRRALDEALKRTTSRTLFGAPLSDMQMTQARLAEMATDIDASALLVYRAAWAKDHGAPRITREASMAKLYATEAAQKVIDSAVQLFGGQGVVVGSPVEELYREIRALRIYEGASEVQLQIIAKQVLASFAT